MSSYKAFIKKGLFVLSRRTVNFIKFPLRYKLLIFEAFFLMGLARVIILLLPFRRVAGLMGTEIREVPIKLDDNTNQKVSEISVSIQRMSRYTPWESKCLVQAIAGQFMLKRRGLPSTLYLGMAKEDGGKKLIAHAWLKCGEKLVTGNRERDRFTAVTQFTSLPRRKAI